MFKSGVKLLLLLSLVSCASTRNKVVLGPFADILYEASFMSEEEINYSNFKQGTMPSLKLAEAIWSLKREDAEILVTLIKGYTAYAFLINETDYLTDKFKEVDESKDKMQAIYNYSQALRYGMLFFKQQGFEFEELVKVAKTKDGIVDFLNSRLSNKIRDLEGVMYFAQALSALINLQKDDMKLVVYASIAKDMYDWVCKNKPDMNLGACGMYYGAYEASRPKMLGGNPELGKEIFKKTIEMYPHNWLARVMYIEHYLIPNGDREGYQTQKIFLNEAKTKLKKEKKWEPGKTSSMSMLGDNKYRIYQIVAIEKFNLIEKFEKNLF